MRYQIDRLRVIVRGLRRLMVMLSVLMAEEEKSPVRGALLRVTISDDKMFVRRRKEGQHIMRG